MKKMPVQEEYLCLEVIEVQILNSWRKFPYKRAMFQEVLLKGKNGEKKIKLPKTAQRTFWKDRKVIELNLCSGEIKPTLWKGDVTYEDIKVGDLFVGRIQEFMTTPYILNGNEEDTYSCVLFEYEYLNPLKAAAFQLRHLEAFPLDENGNPYKVEKSKIEIYDENDFAD